MQAAAAAGAQQPNSGYRASVSANLARELEENYRAALARRRVRRCRLLYKPRQVISLKRLAMGATAKARTRLSAEYLCDILPLALRNELMNSPETSIMCIEPESLHLLLSKNSNECRMDIPFAMPEYRKRPCPLSVRKRKRRQCNYFKLKLEFFKLALRHTAKAGVHSLEVGEITPRNERENGGRKKWGVNILVLRQFLHSLLKKFTDLHELSVINWPGVVNHETLEILGKRHKNLKRLVVRYPITNDNGMTITPEELQTLGSQCTKLEELEVSGTLTDLEASLPVLGELQTIKTSDTVAVNRAVVVYALKTPPPPPLKLEIPVLLCCGRMNRDQVVRVFTVLPNVTEVTLLGFNQETVYGLDRITNPIKRLSVNTGDQHINPYTQQLLMAKFAMTLKSLTIISVTRTVWNLGVILQNCTKLEHLGIISSISINKDFKVGQDAPKLITFELAHICLPYQPNQLQYIKLPDSLTRSVLSSLRLRTLSLRNIELPGSVVTEITDKAQEEGEHLLDDLQELALQDISGLTYQDVLSLLCAAPTLRQFQLEEGGSLTKENLDTILRFGITHNILPHSTAVSEGPPFSFLA